MERLLDQILDKMEVYRSIEYLFKRFSDYLQQPLGVIGEDSKVDEGLCRSFRGRIARASLLNNLCQSS